jgi:hypothetical protein
VNRIINVRQTIGPYSNDQYEITSLANVFSIVLAIFFAGKWNYKIRPAEGNVMVDVAKCVTVSEGTKTYKKNVSFASKFGDNIIFNNTHANLL